MKPNSAKVINRMLMVLGIMLLSCGCATESHLIPDVVVPKPQTELNGKPVVVSLKGKTVVVSDFLRSVHSVDVAQLTTVRITSESISVRDISEQVASNLCSRGISAEGRVKAKVASLSRNEVLVRGAFHTGGHRVHFGAPFICGCTVLLVGGILPSPIPFDEDQIVGYRVEIIDSDGRILVQTGERGVTAKMTGYWMWSMGVSMEKKGEDLVYEKLMESLATALK